MKKYICHGGYVWSRNDNQMHYVGAGKLTELYGVNPKECILINGDKDKARLLGRNMDDYIHLYPRHRYEDYVL